MGFNDERKAFLSAVVLATSAFFAGMGKTVFTDMIFTVFILCAFAMFMLAFKDRRRQGVGIIGFYVCCALATLTKTPLGFVIPQLAVVLFLLYARQMIFLRSRWVPVGILLYLLIALPWYLKMYQLYGQSFVGEYFVNDHWRRWLEAEHHSNDHWFFYPVTMIAGLFPWSLFLAASWVDLFKRLKSSVTVIDYLSLSWILAVLIVFQMAHSKLASYILPLYPALALMTGNFLGNCLRELSYRRSIQRLMMASFIILFLMGIAPMALHKLVGHYLSSSLPVYFLSASLIALGGIGITLAIKERFQLAVYVLALTLFPIFLTAFMIRNFGDDRGATRGMNGVGGAITNFCSEWFQMDIWRDGKHFSQKFNEGDGSRNAQLQFEDPLIFPLKPKDKALRGTRIKFKLSEKVFKTLSFI